MNFLLPHLVDSAADRLPEKDAVRCRGESLTWAELARQANGLAAMLVSAGVRRGDRVGILMNKRVECAIAIHGIMKAGGVYVPLDPGAPPQRHAFIMRDCGIDVLVTDPRKKKAIDSLIREDAGPATVIGIDTDFVGIAGAGDWEDVASAACDTPPHSATMEQDLCYILYTSGSTGVPKGIMHTHRSALAWAEVSAATHDLESADRISNYAPLHFDLSTLDYFAGALAGCTTVMIPEEHARLPMSLAALLEEERLSVFYTVPFALIQLVTSGALDDRGLPALRAVLFGGEPLPVKHLRALMERLQHVSFCNVYGPTETNGCTRFFIPAAPPEDTDALPIGQLYDNVEALVLDEHDRPVKPGDSGELVIRAPTVMRGYWNRPDLNAAASFERESHCGARDRFHRTGDLVRLRSDGVFDFLGRKDRQIKTRGCRLDLDEVEAALSACEGVDEAAVFPVRNPLTGTLDVHAAARRRGDVDVDAGALLRELRSTLPAYAIPVVLSIVDEFPRTSTGKIDRRSLQLAAEEAGDTPARAAYTN